MGWRVGVVGADHALDLGQHAGTFFLRFADDRQGANALAVQRERFGERAGGKEGQPRLGEQAHGRRVFVDAFAKALVGHVQERYVVLGLDHGQHVFPVFRAQVHAGRVMAASVQHNDRTVGQGVEVFQQAAAVHVVGGGVVVAVVLPPGSRRFRTGRGGFPSSGR